MEKEKLNVSIENLNGVIADLKGKELTDYQINRIIDCEYKTFDEDQMIEKEDILSSVKLLAEGYSIKDLENLEISPFEVHKLQKYLEKEDLTEKEVVALRRYCAGRDRIGKKIVFDRKENVNNIDIFEYIHENYGNKLKEEGFSAEEVSQIRFDVKMLEFHSQPLNKTFKQMDEVEKDKNFSEGQMSVIKEYVRDLYSFYHLNETIKELEGALKSNLEDSIKVYYAMKGDDIRRQLGNINNLKGKKIRENNFMSTSLSYDSSEAQYDDYDVVLEMYVPKGTYGRSVTEFLDYENSEDEVLLSESDLYVLDIQSDVNDKNGRNKTILKVLTLSRNKKVYKYIDGNENQYSNQLPKKQNKFMAFLSKLMAKISGKKYENNPEIVEQNEIKEEESNPWKLTSEEKKKGIEEQKMQELLDQMNIQQTNDENKKDEKIH